MAGAAQARITLLGLVLLLVLAAPAAPAWAQEGGEGPSDDEVNAIAEGLYCPVCENIPLDVCGTQACIQWRDTIREKLAAGWTEEEIKNYFVEQYGDRVLATPPARGLNLLVYVLPPVAILAGAFVLLRAFRSWRSAAPITPEASPTLDDDQDPYIARLEEELKRRT